ncbi:MAG: VOC family protein [Sneathiellaceae bacterium]
MSDQPRLQHVNILVDDLDRTVAFYRDVIGLALDETPDLGFPAQFLRLADGSQIHVNELPETRPFRAHFCLVVEDFNAVFRRLKAAAAIDVEPWGKVRRLPSGSMQLFARDPAGNLVELASRVDQTIDPEILGDDLVDTGAGNANPPQSGRGEPRRTQQT